MTVRVLVSIALLGVTGAGCGGSTVSGVDPDVSAGDPDGDSEPDASDALSGTVEATLAYQGVRRFVGADVYLFEAGADAEPCAAIDPAAPSGAFMVTTLEDALSDVARFEDLPRGSRFVVAAAALDETGVVSAFGCSDALEVPGEVIDVDVPLADLPVSLEGVWELESHWRLSEGIPFGTRLVLGILDEMTDDANDPATFLLDLLVAQFIEDDSLRTALGWARQSAGIDRELNEMIRDWAPDLLLDAAHAGGELVRALDDLRVDSRLEIIETGAEGVLIAEHQLDDLVFELDDLDHRFSMAGDVGLRDTTVRDVEVTFDPEGRVDVGPHSFSVGLGTVALFALHEVVLPRLDGAPRTLGEMLSMLVDCREVGDWLSAETGFGSDDDWQDACVLGLEGIGTYLERQILALDENLSSLALEGHAETSGDKLVPRELRDGSWEITWSGGAGSLPFGGTFVALRSGDAAPPGAE